VPLAKTHHVVVDGSNLATEGRTSPSLKQLDEAVRAYSAEDPGADIIVVVDATFEHRVSDAERDEVRNAMLNGEVISPPAGAIGRGDAFVLRIAERTSATVLSNDSFQEFHGEHPWLFDDGRLIGGKPVPGVGWIFTPRLPIRGPKSRAATAEAKAKKDDHASAPAKAAELARAAKKAAKRAAKSKKASKKAEATVDTSWPITPTAPPPGRGKVDPMVSSAIEEAVEEALHPPTPEKPRGVAKKQATAKSASPQRSAKAKKEAASGKDRDGKGSQSRAAAQTDAQQGNKKRKKRTPPPPAVNEPLAFINFVAAYTVGSTIEGEVVSFTSHGAMVDVSLPAGGVLHCYIPLSAMGTPPPTKARQVLKKGEMRPFLLAGLDPSRRVAELSVLGPDKSKKKRGAETADVSPSAATTSAPAKKTAKKTAKKATKKAAKKATGAPAPGSPVKKPAGPAKKAAKRQPKKAAPTKKAPAVVAGAKKAKKAAQAATKAPAKQAAKIPAKRPAKAKKAPAKKAAKSRA
jgi:hypothetical protein